jgi:hypothetical protein
MRVIDLFVDFVKETDSHEYTSVDLINYERVYFNLNNRLTNIVGDYIDPDNIRLILEKNVPIDGRLIKPFLYDIEMDCPEDELFKYFWSCEPFILVRGSCSQRCNCYDKLDCTEFDHNPPCLNNRPDLNCWVSSGAKPIYVLSDICLWHDKCPNCINALVTVLDGAPYSDRGLDFINMWGSFRVTKDKVEIITDNEKCKSLYYEFHNKYGTCDIDCLSTINRIRNIYKIDKFNF